MGREKQGHLDCQLSRLPGFLKRGDSWVGQPGSLCSCVAGNCVTQLGRCLFEMDVIEMDALAIKSLTSGTLHCNQKSLMLGTYTTIVFVKLPFKVKLY